MRHSRHSLKKLLPLRAGRDWNAQTRYVTSPKNPLSLDILGDEFFDINIVWKVRKCLLGVSSVGERSANSLLHDLFVI